MVDHANAITDRGRVEAELHAAEADLAQWRAVFGSMSEGLVVADPQGNLVDWNRAALEMHGFKSLDEVRRHLGEFPKMFELTTPRGQLLELADWPMSRVLRGEAFSGFEVSVRRLDTGLRLILGYSGTPVRDRDGRMILALLTLRDVTRERQAQEELRHSAERLSLAMDAADLGDWSWDASTDMITLSEKAASIFGIPAGPFMTRTRMRELLHEDDRERAQQAATRAVAERGDYNIEYRVPHPDNKVLWVAARGRGQFDAAGNMTGMLGVLQDITERKQTERRRDELLESERAARAEAERASRLKDDFLATVSHELRTPLNAILGYSQLLRAGSGLSSDSLEGIEVIERNARALAQIVDDILDMSRIINGKLRLEVQPLQLRKIVETAMQTVHTSAQAKGIRLIQVIDGPAGTVDGDASRLLQVIWNLLSNAIKFTPRGGTVRVELRQEGSLVEVCVSDTGQGIERDFLPYVFDKFRQADASAARKHGGLGIGLALVKNIVEMHGGTVRVASEGAAMGTTFSFSLPASAKDTAATGLDGQPPGAAGLTNARAGLSLAGINVLAVDDEPDARDLLRRFLGDRGANVFIAASARQALEVLDHQRLDVIVSDIGMPDIDGYELLRLIRARPPDRGGNLPAAALTAFARREDRMRALRAGYQTHVPKPVDPAELIAAIAALVNRTG